MTDRLRDALMALRNLDTSLKPVQFADARETALIEGLRALAAESGRELGFTRIDARGEIAVNVVGPEGDGPGRPSGQYGEELAAWLSTVPRRTGTAPYDGPVLPENGWCRINHFDVERLLKLVAERTLDAEASAGPSGMR